MADQISDEGQQEEEGSSQEEQEGQSQTPGDEGGEGGGEGGQEGSGDDQQAEGDPGGTQDVIGNQPDWVLAMQPSGAKDLAARYTTPGDMAEAFLSLRNKMSTAINVPGEDATAEDVADFRKKMGVPERADGYELVGPGEDGAMDEGFKTKMSEALHKANATPEQAQIMNAAYNEFGVEFQAAQVTADENFAKENDENLRQKWGDAYERNKTAATAFANDDRIWGEFVDAAKEIELANGRFLLDHPIILEAFAKGGLRLSADRLRTGVTTEQNSNLQEELNGLYDKMNGENAERGYWQNEPVQKRIAEINEILHGTDAIVGENERTA